MPPTCLCALPLLWVCAASLPLPLSDVGMSPAEYTKPKKFRGSGSILPVKVLSQKRIGVLANPWRSPFTNKAEEFVGAEGGNGALYSAYNAPHPYCNPSSSSPKGKVECSISMVSILGSKQNKGVGGGLPCLQHRISASVVDEKPRCMDDAADLSCLPTAGGTGSRHSFHTRKYTLRCVP